MDTGPCIERFTSFSERVKTGSNVKISLLVNTHPVATAARIEIDKDPLVTQRSLRRNIERTNIAPISFAASGRRFPFPEDRASGSDRPDVWRQLVRV